MKIFKNKIKYIQFKEFFTILFSTNVQYIHIKVKGVQNTIFLFLNIKTPASKEYHFRRVLLNNCDIKVYLSYLVNLNVLNEKPLFFRKMYTRKINSVWKLRTYYNSCIALTSTEEIYYAIAIIYTTLIYWCQYTTYTWWLRNYLDKTSSFTQLNLVSIGIWQIYSIKQLCSRFMDSRTAHG